ncbi:MAG: S10 family peptidase [Terriglobales bacterium]
MRRPYAALAALLLAALPAAAALPIPKERTVVTHQTAVIAGHRISYTATAGTLLLYNAADHAIASVFYIAYTEDGASPAQRPITFAYNGGPGYASALVDIGGFGPRRIVWPAPGQVAAEQPPYQLQDNPYSILNATDLVFIDAIGTGYSRVVGDGTPKLFYGLSADASAFSQFIRRYIARFGRWNSPKFLLGESYGTTRNAILAFDLVSKGVYLNGVIMCSTVLDFPTINFTVGNDLPFELYLPSYAAVAWYHHQLHPQPPSLPALVRQAEAFAGGPYAHALFLGSKLPAAQKQQTAARLSQLTGIPASLWLKADLRITLPVFRRRVLGPAGPMTGRYDARFTTPELQPLFPLPGDTASGATNTAITGALTASFARYLHHDLHYTSSRLYLQESDTVFRLWNWSFHPPLNALGAGVGSLATPNVASDLARAIGNDPGLQVLFNNGYYDMATPFFATEYTIGHMGLPAALRANIHTAYYPVGHMLYLNPRALPALQRNIDGFIAAATGGHPGA